MSTPSSAPSGGRLTERGRPRRRQASEGTGGSVLRSLRAARPALLLFLASRLVMLVTLVVLNGGHPVHVLQRLAVHWDGGWYLDVARHGYDHTLAATHAHGHLHFPNTAFFPLYPALIRITHAVLGGLVPWGACGLLVAGCSALAAVWGIHAATAHRYGPRIGTLTAVLWGIGPAAVVQTAGYSESTFTALAAWALHATLRRRWLWAGALSVLAGLTRPTGIALALAVMVPAVLEIRDRLRAPRAERPDRGERPPDRRGRTRSAPPARPAGLLRPAAAVVLAPLGWLGFVVWTAWRLHRWNAYFRVQDEWHSRFDFGHSTFLRFKTLFTRGAPVHLYVPVVAAVLAAAVVLLVVAVLQRQPLPFLIFSFVTVVIALGDAAYFAARARFLLPAFPLLMPVATMLARLRNHATLVPLLASAALASAAYGTYLMLYSSAAP
ncbi:hypothetical protein [Streptomyces sp. NPDC020917]|uniref:hypothetical protein n=1 Tax=Streptomyces sp. NPDC020917 TaxID=3365102 RepID=UPI003796386E